jgi:hypothetical protein
MSQSQKQDPPQFDMSFIQCIRSAKIVLDPVQNLKTYRVTYSTAPFVSTLETATMDNNADAATNLKGERSVWVPAPIIQAALPSLVLSYYNSKSDSDHELVVHPTTAQPSTSSDEVIDLTLVDSDSPGIYSALRHHSNVSSPPRFLQVFVVRCSNHNGSARHKQGQGD